MNNPLIPEEFKRLLDSAWMQARENELVDLIRSELGKVSSADQSVAHAIQNINNAFLSLADSIKKHFIALVSSILQSAQKKTYEDAGIEKYQVKAFDDDRTCDHCTEMHDKVFLVKDFRMGKTAPLFHFFCRCITMPYYDSDGEGEMKINSLDDFFDSPKKFGDATPEQYYKYFQENGYNPQPLGSKSSLKGVPFHQGGGFRINWGGDRYLQYHPSTSSHHGGAYWKISSGPTGTLRFDLNGNLLP